MCWLFVLRLDVGFKVELDVGDFVFFNVVVVLIRVMVVIGEKLNERYSGI